MVNYPVSGWVWIDGQFFSFWALPWYGGVIVRVPFTGEEHYAAFLPGYEVMFGAEKTRLEKKDGD